MGPQPPTPYTPHSIPAWFASDGVFDWETMRRLAFAMLVLLLGAEMAVGKLCGDDVDGRDVPCACGDVVVSDLVLDDDPVAVTVCDGDGLLVRATSTDRVSIDLAGKTLRGRGEGHGILVVHGGGGAHVTGGPQRAVIEGFDHGVVAAGGELGLLENVDIRNVVHDGVRLRGDGTVRQCTVTRAGRDGFSFSGRFYRATGNRSRENGRHGFMLMGHGGTLTDNEAQRCGGAGFLVTGAGHSIETCVAEACAKNGLELVTSGAVIRACVATGNGASGIEGHGSGWRLADNAATGNHEHGIKARGPDMIDDGGNSGSDNGAKAPDRFEQCRVGDAPCASASARVAR